MDRFEYRAGMLWCEETPAADLADRFGTPLYVYSRATFESHFVNLRQAFARLGPLICFSVKSCQNVHILRVLREAGSGFDVVSGGELHRALLAGADPATIVFAGVGKTDRELQAGLDARIGLFNAESASELERLSALAAGRPEPPSVALRINPDVDPKTHAFTATGKKESKFGVDIEQAAAIIRQFARLPTLRLRGVHLHIGSPVYDVLAYDHGIRRALMLIDEFRTDGFEIDTLDLGGGYGAAYSGDDAPPLAEYARVIVPLLQDRGLRVILEPGRAIAANAGVLLTRVLHVKDSGGRRFVIVDAAMNELIRPALYGAYHFIWPVCPGTRMPATRGARQPFDGLHPANVVGPVCESADFLAKDRLIPPVARGDLLAVFTAGAYAMTMASQYNSRPRAAEVLVTGTTAALIRRRETYDDLVAPEML